MQRRLALGLLAGLTLSACGFQPRGEQTLPPSLRHVSLNEAQQSSLTQTLGQLLQQGGATLVRTAPMPADTVHIRLSKIHVQRREAMFDRQANLRQIELIQRVQLDVRRQDGSVVIDSETFEAVRSTSYNPLSLLAQGEEEQRLRNELDAQLAQSILARLRSKLSS